MAPIKPGQAVLTGGHNLPNRWVIHCLGPVYGTDKPKDQLLADCYRNALKLADEQGIKRLAFPALSTGAFGYPAEEAAQVCAATLEAVIPSLHKVRLIRFVLFNEAARHTLHQSLAQRLTIDPSSVAIGSKS